MLRGGAILLAGRLGVAMLGWAGTLVVARQLSPSDWGAYSLVFSLLGLIGILTDLRVSRSVLGDLLGAEDDAGRVVGSYLTLRAALGLVGYALAMAVVAVGDYPSVVVAATGAAGLVLVLGPTDAALDVFLSARGWWRTQALPAVMGQAIQLALILVLAATATGDVVSFAVTALAFYAVTLALKLAVVRRHLEVRPRIERDRWRVWAREASAVAVGGAITTIYLRIDSVLLSQLDTLEAVGLYGIGYKFSDLAAFVAFAVCTPTLTALVGAWPDDPLAFALAFRHAFALMVVGAVGVAFGFALFAVPLVDTLYGERFIPAAGSARLLMAGQAVNYLTTLCFTVLVAVGRNRRYVVAAVAGLVVNVALNLVLIPIASYDGAAAATVATEVVVLVLLGHATLEVPGVRPLPWRVLGASAASAVAMAATAVILGDRLAWPVAATAAGCAYLGGLAVLGVGRDLRRGPA